ncbi:hypothetical protein WN944_009630 [Citrus x changshan-huyou]|uniref:Uncharacterized protein n=1 Tax=Citrus x changshan-huyou TaxID=2935761 RepID=A0AAP0QZY6_9ROSI
MDLPEYDEINNYEVLSDNMAHKSFYCGPKETKALGNQLPCHLKGCSIFDLLTAFIWKCRTIALEIEPEKIARVSCIIKTRGNFIVSDISNVGLGEVNFEWKKPIYAETAGAVALISFSVKHQNKNGELGILVPICLLQSTVERFQEELKRMMIQGSMEDLCNINQTQIFNMLYWIYLLSLHSSLFCLQTNNASYASSQMNV